MRAFYWLGTVVVGAGPLGCQSVSVRPLETAAGPAIEVRCSEPKACRRETARITCPTSNKAIHPVSQTHLVVTCELGLPDDAASSSRSAEFEPRPATPGSRRNRR